MADKSFIYSIFANDEKNSLESLKEELRDMRQLLNGREDLDYEAFVYGTSSQLKDEIVKYASKINIFHFSGHANGQTLKLEKAADEREDFDLSLLSGYLQKDYCKNIKLIFLNACNTHKLGIELIKKEVPAVICTYGLVPDSLAKEVASEFYKYVRENKGKTLRELLKDLEVFLGTWKKAQVKFSAYRGGHIFDFEDEITAEPDQALWGILYHEQRVAELDDFVPLPDTVPDMIMDLPEDLNALPEEIAEVDTQLPIIKEGFSFFNYEKQLSVINNHFGKYATGAFFAYGARNSGVNWFCHNLLSEVRYIKNATPTNNIVFGDNLETVERLEKEIMEVLSLPDHPGKSNLENLADGIFGILQHQSILLRIYDEQDIAKEILADIEAQLWKPLAAALQEKIDNRDTDSVQTVHKLLILLIDDRTDQVEHLVFEDEALKLEQELIRLPQILDVDENALGSWKFICKRIHGETFWGNLFQQEQVLLGEKKPYRLLKKAAELLGYEFDSKHRDYYHLKKSQN